MKYTNIHAFEKHLEASAPDHFSQIYLLISKEPFVRNQAISTLKSLFLKDEIEKSALINSFDADKHRVDPLLAELNAYSFFSRKRIVMAYNVDLFDKEATLKLEKYAKNPNKTICFVASATSINKATTFYKNMEKEGVILDIPEEKSWEKEKTLPPWLSFEATKMGYNLSSPLSQLMVKKLGVDQEILYSELQKLICYVGDVKTITEEDILTITSSNGSETLWQLCEMIFLLETAKALSIIKSLLQQGLQLIALLRQMRSQFQTEFQVLNILINGGNPSHVTESFPHMKGFILDRHIRQSENYGFKRFQKGLLLIDAAEFKTKNTQLEPLFLAEKLIIELTL